MDAASPGGRFDTVSEESSFKPESFDPTLVQIGILNGAAKESASGSKGRHSDGLSSCAIAEPATSGRSRKLVPACTSSRSRGRSVELHHQGALFS